MAKEWDGTRCPFDGYQVRTDSFRDCIDAIKGAMAFGQQDMNPPPEAHWLAEFWEIGRKLAASPAAPTEAELRAEFERQHQGRNLKQHRLRGTYFSAPIAALWNQHKRTAMWMQSRTMAAAVAESPAAPSAAEAVDVQWWLAELDQYGNAKLVDGQHSDRAGADKAMYLFNALGLAKVRRYAVARIELFEPKPSAEGVNHEAIEECNNARAALRASKGGV